MNALFVYGTLRPGHSNAHILENIGGEWLAGFVSGTFYERGWGAAADFPGIVLHPMDRASKAICLSLITFPHTGKCWMSLKTAMTGLRSR
jgi:hypothetical protein